MKKYIYISSREDKEKYLIDNFSNLYFIKSNPSQRKLNNIIKKIINDKIEIVILEDYFIGIDNFIKELNKINVTVKIVWTNGLGTLNEEIELDNLNYVMELLNNELIKEVSFTEENIYLAFKSFKGVSRLLLSVKNNKTTIKNKSNNIGILGDTYDWRSNIYNQISAVKMIDNYNVCGIKIKALFKRFSKLFNINYFNYNDIEKFIENSNVISCIEFSSLYTFEILEAFNKGIPCVLGNNINIFKNTELEELIVVKSDDNINEIADKLKFSIKNKNKILKIYKSIKKEYDIKSANSISKLIEE